MHGQRLPLPGQHQARAAIRHQVPGALFHPFRIHRRGQVESRNAASNSPLSAAGDWASTASASRAATANLTDASRSR